MKLKLGAERKKVAFLGALVLFLVVYLIFFNGSNDDRPVNPPQAARVARMANPTPATAPPDIRRAAPIRGSRALAASAEFKPTLKPKRPEDRPDPTTVDPALRLDLLAKLQQVKSEGGERSLFEFSSAPPPKPVGPPEKKIHAKLTQKGAMAAAMAGAGAVAGAPTTPLKPAAPPIPLKFYGYLSPLKLGVKRAFFLSGEDIFVASEGELVQKRYRVVRIGVNSVVMEDTQFKSEQTLPLEALPG